MTHAPIAFPIFRAALGYPLQELSHALFCTPGGSDKIWKGRDGLGPITSRYDTCEDWRLNGSKGLLKGFLDLKPGMLSAFEDLDGVGTLTGM